MVILFIQEIFAPDVADAVIKKPFCSELGEGRDTGLILHGNMPSIEEIPRRLVGIETQGGCHTPHSEVSEGHDAGLVIHGDMPSIEEIPRRLVGMETQGGCHTPHAEASEGHDAGLILQGNMPSIEEIPRRLVGTETQECCHTPHSESSEGLDAGHVIHGNMPSIEGIPRRLVGVETQGAFYIASAIRERMRQRARLHGSPSDLVMTRPSTFIVAQETLLFQSVASKHGTKSQSSTMINPSTNPFPNSGMYSVRSSIKSQPFAVIQMKLAAEPTAQQMEIRFTIQPSTMLISPVKLTSGRMMLKAGVFDSQPYSQGAEPEPRSKSLKLVLPAGVPSSNVTMTSVRSTPPPVMHLISGSPLPKRNNAKLQSIKEKFAKQVQKRKEAVSRATKAARFLRNTWTHDARYRRGMKVKRQAEKQVRSSTYTLQAICQEEMDFLSNLEKKRRRRCERWANANGPSHGTN
ncbi:hypothetical protein MMC29_001476 [Sticta canariensis]|nr:hypothetical protein [Sticta canariensis]